MKQRILQCLLCGAGLAAGSARLAVAQGSPAVTGVYTYVEQMPRLPGGGGTGAIGAAIEQRVQLPAAPNAGTVFVRFVVTTTGEVSSAKIIKGVSAAADAAVLAAVGQLPRFVPGKQNGRLVDVMQTIPVRLPTAAAAPVPAPNPGSGLASAAAPLDSSKVYTYCEQMPALPGGGGQGAIVAAIQQRLVAPAGAPAGRVFLNFTVGPHGTTYDARIIKGLGPSADAAALAAVGQLPRFVPGKQNGQLVAVSFTVPVTFGALPSPPGK